MSSLVLWKATWELCSIAGCERPAASVCDARTSGGPLCDRRICPRHRVAIRPGVHACGQIHAERLRLS